MKELEMKVKEYEDFFNDSFPTFCFMHLSFKETIEIIDTCLEEGKDVYELGLLQDDHEVNY